MIWSSGCTRKGHHRRYHRFFSQAAWSLDRLCEVLARLVVSVFVPTGRIELAVDDTLGRKRGLTVYDTGTHHDPLISSRKRGKQPTPQKRAPRHRTRPELAVESTINVELIGHVHPKGTLYEPSFADMLTTLRRLRWQEQLRTLPFKGRVAKKSLAPLVEFRSLAG